MSLWHRTKQEVYEHRKWSLINSSEALQQIVRSVIDISEACKHFPTHAHLIQIISLLASANKSGVQARRWETRLTEMIYSPARKSWVLSEISQIQRTQSAEFIMKPSAAGYKTVERVNVTATLSPVPHQVFHHDSIWKEFQRCVITVDQSQDNLTETCLSHNHQL